MKKIVLLSFAFAAILSSCSNDELVSSSKEQGSNVIAFSTYVNKSTRTTDITTANIGSLAGGFSVFGYTTADITGDQNSNSSYTTLFDNEAVVSNDGGETFTYENLQYWEENSKYTFHAIAPHGKAASVDEQEDQAHWEWDYNNLSGDDNNIAKIKFTNIATDGNDSENNPIYTACGKQDLVYAFYHIDNATKGDAVSDNSNLYQYNIVSLNFSHLLSRVKFRFVGDIDNPTSVNIQVNNIKLNGTSESGEITISNIDSEGKTISSSSLTTLEDYGWEHTSSTAILPFGDALNGFSTGYAESDHRYIFPATSSSNQLSVDLDFVITAKVNNPTEDSQNRDRIYKRSWLDLKLPQIDMQKGYSYVYIISVKTTGDPNDNNLIEPIVFGVQVEEWKVDGTEEENNESQGNDWIQIKNSSDYVLAKAAQVGDLLMSDGSFLHIDSDAWTTLLNNIATVENADEYTSDEDLASAKAAIAAFREDVRGIVYSTNTDENWSVGGKTHGLVASIKDFSEIQWQTAGTSTSLSAISNFQSQYNSSYESISSTDNNNGYTNSEILRAFNVAETNSNKEVIPVIQAVDKLGNIANTTGWFIPSVKELKALYTASQSTNDSFNERFSAIASFASGFYWTSTESDSSNAYSVNFTVYPEDYDTTADTEYVETGSDATKAKGAYLYVRAICAF